MRALSIIQVLGGCLASDYADLDHPATEFKRTSERCDTYKQRKGDWICLRGTDENLYYYEPVYYQPEEPVWDYDQWYEDAYTDPRSYHPYYHQPVYAAPKNQALRKRVTSPGRSPRQAAVEYGDYRDSR